MLGGGDLSDLMLIFHQQPDRATPTPIDTYSAACHHGSRSKPDRQWLLVKTQAEAEVGKRISNTAVEPALNIAAREGSLKTSGIAQDRLAVGRRLMGKSTTGSADQS